MWLLVQRRRIQRIAARHLLTHYRVHRALNRRWFWLLDDRTLARIVVRGEIEWLLRECLYRLRRLAGLG
ncbi:MAG: hypothetical protein RO009_01195 [Pseudorhodoplanes sp.]|nr:hypothetical protein [Pseudorhodoplanes sp.]